MVKSGLAAQGYRPFCAIYSTFLQRAYDQVVHDIAIQNLPVRFAMDRAGLVGADGAVALAKGAGQQCLPDDVDHVAAMRGCSCGEQDVGDPATGAADPSRP